MSAHLFSPLTVSRQLLALLVAFAAASVQAGPVPLDDDKPNVANDAALVDPAESPAPAASDASALGALRRGESAARSPAKRVVYDTFARGVAGAEGIDDLDYAASAPQAGPGHGASSGRGKDATLPANAASAGAKAKAADEPNEWKSLAKSTWKWLHDALPWNHSESEDGQDVDGAARTDGAGFARGDDLAQPGPRAGPNSAALGRPGDGSGYEKPRDSYGDNPLRQAIQTWRSFLTHPLTWLVVALIGAGRVAVSIAGRRRK
jgi:hypothetical protein